MKHNDNSNRYDDIIDLPHHVSTVYPQMTPENRAAQFSPFAALTGYDEEVRECARLTDEKTALDEDAAAVLDEKLQILMMHIEEHPEVSFTCFIPDAQKEGGSYDVVAKPVRSIDTIRERIIFQDKTSIALCDIVDMRGAIFHAYEDIVR